MRLKDLKDRQNGRRFGKSLHTYHMIATTLGVQREQCINYHCEDVGFTMWNLWKIYPHLNMVQAKAHKGLLIRFPECKK